jgi:hypothetical protein
MTHSKQHDQKRKATGADSGAWTAGGGEEVPETDVAPPSGVERNGTDPSAADNQGGPETGPHGTDQESNVPGRSKPASEPAEDALPNSAADVPNN